MDIQLISKMMKKHWDGKIPVNVKAIAKSMNVKLIPLSFDESYKTSLKTKIVDESNSKTIFYNTKGNSSFQNILITHALARIVLNQVKENQIIEDAENFDLIKYKTSDDLEANLATYQIIMPAKEVKNSVNHYLTSDPQEIAHLFGTNTELAYNRMKDLKLIEA